MRKAKAGNLIVEGKTKKVHDVVGHPECVLIVSKDDITAGNGEKHDVLDGKGKIATLTTCSVFSFLRKFDIPTAFGEQISADRFLALKCEMIPLEIVMRRIVYGSYQKRYPFLSKGKRLHVPALELFLKTTNKKFGDVEVPWDDPLIGWFVESGQMGLMNPGEATEEASLLLPYNALGRGSDRLDEAEIIVRKAFMALETAWASLGFELLDCKFELGLDAHGTMRIADVVDNDSWRLTKDGVHYDKQCYRDGEHLAIVRDRYAEVATWSNQLELPPALAAFFGKN